MFWKCNVQHDTIATNTILNVCKAKIIDVKNSNQKEK